jgi:hypothetical protein
VSWLALFALIAATPSAPAVNSAVDIQALMLEVTRDVNGSNPSSISALFQATSACEDLLSISKIGQEDRSWLLRFEYDGSAVFTKDGILIMHRLSNGDFPESCGVIAVPTDNYESIKQAFERKYDSPILPNDSDDSGRLYPSANIGTEQYTYRLRSAEYPKEALSIVVRNKEK